MMHEFFAFPRSCPAADRRSQMRAAGKAVEDAGIKPA